MTTDKKSFMFPLGELVNPNGTLKYNRINMIPLGVVFVEGELIEPDGAINYPRIRLTSPEDIKIVSDMQSEIVKIHIKELGHEMDMFHEVGNTEMVCLSMRESVYFISGQTRVRKYKKDIYNAVGDQKVTFQLIARLDHVMSWKDCDKYSSDIAWELDAIFCSKLPVYF